MKVIKCEEKIYHGISNPSGAVALDERHFIVGDDEDNALRIFDRNHPDKAVQKISLSALFKGVIENGKGQEIDLESAAQVGHAIFWIGSHSTNGDGESRPSRHRLFAVTVNANATGKYSVSAAGSVYSTLIDDLADDPRYQKYRFDKARKIQAKAIDGLSIEGLASTPDNTLLIGFRNPLHGGEVKHDRLVKGKALVVELKNPLEVVYGIKAKFGAPAELDLGGFGIRELTRYKKHKYLVVGGPYHANIPDERHGVETGHLYLWSRKSKNINKLKKLNLEGYNMEAVVVYPGDENGIELLSDDGKISGSSCFRSLSLSL